jgi:Flp pilus assembly protein TadG
MKKSRHGALGGQRGNELLEFALVLPLLLLLLAGAIEFGRAFYTYNILTKSVRNGARYLSDTQMTLSGVILTSPVDYVTRTKNLAVYGNVSGSGTKVIPDLLTSQINVTGTAAPGPAAGQFYVTVSANYAYSPVFGFLLPGITFRPKVTMIFVGVFSGT